MFEDQNFHPFHSEFNFDAFFCNEKFHSTFVFFLFSDHKNSEVFFFSSWQTSTTTTSPQAAAQDVGSEKVSNSFLSVTTNLHGECIDSDPIVQGNKKNNEKQ